jgi:hypothetical protein
MKLVEYAVWNKADTYVISAESAIKAIQCVIELHSSFVPASEWNYMPMLEYSDKVQNKIRANAITA